MTTLFNVTFENNMLIHPITGYDNCYVSGGTLEVAAAAAYEGSYGLKSTPLAGTVTGGGKVTHDLTGKFRTAFYFDPNSITIPSGSYIMILRNFHYDLSQQAFNCTLTWNGSSYGIDIGLADNTLNIVTWSSVYTFTDAWHLFEFYWQRGSPGSFQLWIDGTSQGTITATNTSVRFNNCGIGCNLRSSPSVSTTGSVYFDRWIANDDGSQIGGV